MTTFYFPPWIPLLTSGFQHGIEKLGMDVDYAAADRHGVLEWMAQIWFPHGVEDPRLGQIHSGHVSMSATEEEPWLEFWSILNGEIAARRELVSRVLITDVEALATTIAINCQEAFNRLRFGDIEGVYWTPPVPYVARRKGDFEE